MKMDNLKNLLIFPVCLLAACAPPKPMMEQRQGSALEQPAPKSVSVEQHKEKTKMVSSWEIRGAIAAKSKAKGWSAAMNWRQTGANSYQIRLLGPLGAGAVLISKSGGTITFQDGPKKITSDNADDLLLKQTGIRLPVNNLYYWVRGLPAPGSVGAEQQDQEHRLVQLKQNGYTINFGNYTTVKGAELPGLVRLEGNGVMIKVVIKNWTV